MKFDRRQLMVYAVTDRLDREMSLCEQVEAALKRRSHYGAEMREKGLTE